MSFSEQPKKEAPNQGELKFPSVDDVKNYFVETGRSSFKNKIDEYDELVRKLLSENSNEKRESVYKEYINKMSAEKQKKDKGFLDTIKAGIDKMLEKKNK